MVVGGSGGEERETLTYLSRHGGDHFVKKDSTTKDPRLKL